MIVYVVRYDGGSSKSFSNENPQNALKSARAHAQLLQYEGYTGVKVLRGGRNADKDWSERSFRPKPKLTPISRGEIVVHDEAWSVSEGFVDTEADKHGPVIHVPVTTLSPLLSNKEKSEWAANYRPRTKTCLWH